MSIRFTVGALAVIAALAACERNIPTAGNDEGTAPPLTPASRYSVERDAMDRLARKLARALADPAFRSYLKGELDRSPFPEHKLQLQNLLFQSDHRVLKEVARLVASSESEVETDLEEAIPIEIYFPVPAHRAGWDGGDNVLVASARQDREAPIAYDVSGRRQVLDPDSPPSTPVLAVVPVETDFSHPNGPGSEATCTTCGGGGGGTSGPPAGLYMTYSHFVQDFEGWLKGDPEFEYHILGQSGASDSLRDYQCVGGAAGGYSNFDQNDLNWTGSVLLFSQTQLNSYKISHPNQNFRIVALEDDDGACAIRFDANRFLKMVSTLQSQYPNLSGAKDTTSGIVKIVKRANALQKILAAVYNFITTQDDLIGSAIEDVVVGQYYPGANWVVKGENNATNGWAKLEMR
jgi:hypothetical protein